MTPSAAGAMRTISTISLEAPAGAQETTRTLHGMVELSEQLNEGISQFKIKEDVQRTFPRAATSVARTVDPTLQLPYQG